MNGSIRKLGTGVIVGMALTALVAEMAHGGCREEPTRASFASQSVIGWDLSPNGMIMQYYSEEGRPSNHVTLHRIVEQGFELASEEELKASFGPSISVLRIQDPDTDIAYFYAFMTQALLYGSDPDALGLPAHVWMDAEEDGLAGNEQIMASSMP
jgi:hypothetical protein